MKRACYNQGAHYESILITIEMFVLRIAEKQSEGLNERDIVSFEKDSPCMGALSGKMGGHAKRTYPVAVKVGQLSHRLHMYRPLRRSYTHQSPDKR